MAEETSDDPTAVINGGDLWYVSAFDLPYDFENIIYKAKQNSLIGPIKTKQGYHIIKVENRRANFGSCKVAHILLPLIENDTLKKVKSKIDSIYGIIKLQNNFSELAAKFSKDESTNIKMGVLPWFSTNQMPHEFEEATYNLLKNGDVSKPVKTASAWHIIRRIDKKEIPSFIKIKEQIEHKVKKSDRYALSEKSLLNKIKKENEIKEYYSIFEIKSAIDSTIFEGRWQIPDSISFDKVLFSINNIRFLQSDFVNYLYKNQKPIYATSTDNYVDGKYKKYIYEELVKLEVKKLELKYPEYRNSLKNFSEEILHDYFVEKNILRNGVNIEDELKNYYLLNKEKYNNAFHSTFSFLQYESYLNTEKLEKVLKKYKKREYKDDDLINKIENSLKTNIKFLKKEEFIEGNNEIADIVFTMFKQKQINKKTNYVFLKKKNLIVCIKSKIERFIKPIDIIKDTVIADYRLDVERKIISELKSKYEVNINENVFESLLN